MPIIVRERKTSRESNVSVDPAGNSLTLEFQVFGTGGEMDDFQARAAVAEASPPTYAGLVRESYSVKPLKAGMWEAQVLYTPRHWSESVRSFDTSGGTAHVNVSRQTIRSASWDVDVATPPDFKGAIGVNGDTVEGCDVTVPVFAYQETHSVAASKITQAYVEILFTCTGKVNHATWRYFPPEIVLFLGAQGSQRGGVNDPWEITFKFAVSPDRTVPIGNSGNTILKEGWAYLWTRYADKISHHTLVKQPVASYVERLYEVYDFTDLGIGV